MRHRRRRTRPECVADKGSRAVLRALNDSPWKTRIAAPKQTGFSRWHGDEAARRAVTNNRARLKSGVAREAFKLRAEIVERCFPRQGASSERAFGTLQNRLVKELALAGVTTIEAANRFIAETYLPDHNRRFATPPELEDSAFVALARPDQIDDILCLHAERTVARDNTVSYGKRVLQIPAGPGRPHYVKAYVRVHEYPDGTLAAFHGPRRLARYHANGAPVESQTRKAA